MEANLRTLFEDSKENNGKSSKSPSQLRFEEKQQEEIAVLVQIVNEAFDEMRSQVDDIPSGFKNHLSKPNRMNEQVKGKLTEYYGDKVKPLSYNRFGLFLNDYVLLFKKFDNKGLPSNIRTKNSVMLSTKGKLNFPGEPEIVFIGFTVTPGYEQIKSIKATKIVDEAVQWSINLEGLAGDIRRSISSKPIDTVEELIVRPKSHRDSKTG